MSELYQLADLFAKLAGTGFLVTFAIYLWRRLVAFYARVRDFVEKFNQLVTTSTSTALEVQWMVKELRPNGGASMRDSLSRVERILVFERMARRMTVTGVPIYERSEHGEVMYVSPAFVMLTGLNTEDCQDLGWARVVSQEDRPRVLQAYRSAHQEQTYLAEEFTIVSHTDGSRYRVQMEEQPVFFNEHLVGWLGRWTPKN